MISIKMKEIVGKGLTYVAIGAASTLLTLGIVFLGSNDIAMVRVSDLLFLWLVWTLLWSFGVSAWDVAKHLKLWN